MHWYPVHAFSHICPRLITIHRISWARSRYRCGEGEWELADEEGIARFQGRGLRGVCGPPWWRYSGANKAIYPSFIRGKRRRQFVKKPPSYTIIKLTWCSAQHEMWKRSLYGTIVYYIFLLGASYLRLYRLKCQVQISVVLHCEPLVTLYINGAIPASPVDGVTPFNVTCTWYHTLASPDKPLVDDSVYNTLCCHRRYHTYKL